MIVPILRFFAAVKMQNASIICFFRSVSLGPTSKKDLFSSSMILRRIKKSLMRELFSA
jgi:hypothetical protein